MPSRSWVLAGAALSLMGVAGISMAATVVREPGPEDEVVMLVGDSVPQNLAVTFERHAAERGWRIVTATHGGCPVTGEVATHLNGEQIRHADACTGDIVTHQDELVGQIEPDIVLWWDRWSLSSYVTSKGELALTGSDLFWRDRRRTLALAVERLSARGATVVLLATEPPSTTILDRCSPRRCHEWIDIQVTRYDDVTSRWNAMMERYAARHPRTSAFISITDVVCAADVSPCVDTIGGMPARADGIHYVGAGADLAAGTITRLLAPYMSSAAAPSAG